MTNPLPVTIVRPDLGWKGSLTSLLSGLIGLAVRGWVVMILVPLLSSAVHPAFWQCVAACVVVGTLIGNQDQYRWWSKAPR